MHHRPAEVQAETPRDTLHDVDAVASDETLANGLAEVKPLTRGDKLADIKAGTLDKIKN